MPTRPSSSRGELAGAGRPRRSSYSQRIATKSSAQASVPQARKLCSTHLTSYGGRFCHRSIYSGSRAASDGVRARRREIAGIRRPASHVVRRRCGPPCGERLDDRARSALRRAVAAILICPPRTRTLRATREELPELSVALTTSLSVSRLTCFKRRRACLVNVRTSRPEDAALPCAIRTAFRRLLKPRRRASWARTLTAPSMRQGCEHRIVKVSPRARIRVQL